MKIVSFPHYTCGGLLCDILNKTFSPVDYNGGIGGDRHNLGKIGDGDSIYTDFDFGKLKQQLSQYPTDQWIGTHCWLGKVDLSIFGQIINITTVTHRSKVYRWVRAYHHYYLKSDPWQNLNGIDEIDKQRETAKNYLKSFEPIKNDCVTNLEFADVVELRPAFSRFLLGDCQHHISRWQEINAFLFDQHMWRSSAADRFYEAEYEEFLQQRYVYE